MAEPIVLNDEAVAFSGDGAKKTWPFYVFAQGGANLSNRSVDAVLGIDKDVFAPEPFDDLVPGRDCAVFFEQKDEQLHRNAFKPYDSAVTPQLETRWIKLEVAKFVGGSNHTPPPSGPANYSIDFGMRYST